MKKLIFLLLTITFTIVSFLSIKQFEFLDFQAFNYNSNYLEKNWNLEIKEGNPQKSKLENFQMLTKIVDKAKVNLQRTSYELTENNQEKIVYYIALYDPDKYFEKIKLKNGKYLDEKSNTNDFMSTLKTNSTYQIGQLEIFHSFNPIEIRPLIAAGKTKEVRGTYILKGTNNVEVFKKLATNYGFSIELSQEQSNSLFTEYPYQDMIYITCVVLCLLILLAMFYDIINNYKAIAIRYLHGDNFFHIGLYLLKRYLRLIFYAFILVWLILLLYLYFYNQYQQIFPFLIFWIKNISILILTISLILLFSWIGTKSIGISQAIKNQKPVKTFFYLNCIVRFILAIFLILGLEQGIHSFQKLRDTLGQQAKWDVLKKYSFLGMEMEGKGLDTKDERQLYNFKKLYKEFEEQGSIYISPSNYYFEENGNKLPSKPWGIEGKQVKINKNYLDVNPIFGVNGNEVELPKTSKSELVVLVPQKYKKDQEDIKETIKEEYEAMINRNQAASIKINIIYVKNEQSYFTFSTKMAEKSKYQIKDPIAVIITPEFEPTFTASTIAMGYGYYTKNNMGENPFKNTQETLKKYGLDNIWSPVSVAYASVEQKISNDTEKLQLNIINVTLFILLAAVLLFFSAVYYLEINKQTFALQWIFGYRFIERHNIVYLALLVFWQFSFIVCFFISSNTFLLGKISLGLAVFDIILISCLIILKEQRIIKHIIIEK
ncbi:hypothetical protein [Bacillus arachidis]|uniref:hypothetical protein n=1 Tax=Bacillus arachidis TaxID=2819290 RepID=UPI00255CC724|nr:hypothetical protein [Bacillus arachidis]WIY58769.1 hypothetical protein QRY57_00690 [Bacillus arachidis]